MAQKIIVFLKNHEAKIAIIIGFILIAAISFEFGLIQGKKGQNKPLVIETPVVSQNLDAQATSATTPQAQKTAQEAQNDPTSANIPPQGCAFVGSKNSDKYHLPTCQWAKRILPKNLVCYKSAEDAISKGKVGDKGCIK